MKSAIGEQHQAGHRGPADRNPAAERRLGLRRRPVDRPGDRHPHLDGQETAGQHPDGGALGDRASPRAACTPSTPSTSRTTPPSARSRRAWPRRRSSTTSSARAPGGSGRRRGRLIAQALHPGLRRRRYASAVRAPRARRPAEAGAAPDQDPRDRAGADAPGHQPDAHRGLPAPRAGRHLRLQPAHRPERRRRRPGGGRARPTPPSPRSAST